MKRLLLFWAVVFAAMFSACTEDESSPVGDVYGIVSDLKSGAPVRNAEVIISPSNASTVSGSDGHFEFKSLTPGQYKISVEADGYSSNSRQVTVVAGQRISCDIHLAPEADNDVISINPTSIDFGTNELQIAATVTNESDSETEWFLDLGNTPWLYAYPTTGRIGGGKTHSIVFTANRARMNEDKSSVVNISAFGDTHPLSLKCKQSVQLSSVMVVESLNVDFGEEATEQIIRIRNVSETDVNWTLYKVQSERLSMSSTYGIVAPGSSQIVTISLDREGLDEVLATTFMISDGTVDQPVNVIAYPTPEDVASTYFELTTDVLDFGEQADTLTLTLLNVGVNSFGWKIAELEHPDVVTCSPSNGTLDGGAYTDITVFLNRSALAEGAFESSFVVTDGVNTQGVIVKATHTYPPKTTPDGNEIFYTTTDGNINEYYDPTGFLDADGNELNIVSNVYEDGRGVITFDGEIKTIEIYSLWGNLTSITIPDSVDYIEDDAIHSGSMQKFIGKFASEDGRFLIADGSVKAFAPAGMTSVIIPDGVTSIGRYVFSGYEIESVTIPEGVTTIGEEAFFECQSLASINIPNTVTTIGESAFGVCYGLKSLAIPDSVTTIGYGAFQSCKNLTSVTIGSGLTEISTWMFAGCSSLTNIVIPESVSAIGARAFGSCSSLTRVDCLPTTPPTIGSEIFYDVSANCKIYVPDGTYDTYVTADGWVDYKDMIVNPNASAVQSQIFYTTTDGAIVEIGNTIGWGANIVSNVYENNQGVITFDGEVTSIGSQAFYDCSNITSINIPDGVTSIGDGAFWFCSGLTSINIPDAVTSIGANAFTYCSKLTSVTIGKNVTSIGNSAFNGCSSLTSITIPDGVTSIGSGTFGSCTSLTSITIPDGVTSIENYTFDGCSSLTSITIPDGVTSIGDSTFLGCSGLTSIEIPDGVTSIGNSAFNGCSSLTSITIPDGVTSIGSGTFGSCTSLTSITIPDGVTSIEKNAFISCSSLTSITIPNGVTSIGYGAFCDCIDLTSVYCLPTTPPTMGLNTQFVNYSQFEGVSADCRIYVPDGTYDAYVTADGWAQYKDMIVNPNPAPAVQSQIFYTSTDGAIVTPYNTSAFLDADGNALNIVSNTYENGQGVIIVDGEIKSLDANVFYYCSNLVSINIPDCITSIGNEAFAGCSGLTSFIIPDGVISIGRSGFYGCSNLASINIPDSITSIGNAAFQACTSLTSITIPNGLTSIGVGVFDGCSGLTSLNIPDTVTSIGDYAFRNCTGLTSITIPDGVTSIRTIAFQNCTNLASVYCRPTTPPTLGSNTVFNSNASDRKIYVPTASVDAYKAAESWSDYADAIVGYDF